jgi:hypothetical protein
MEGGQAVRTSTETLIAAMHILATEIQSDDGVANSAIAEAGERLAEQHMRITQLEHEIELFREHADYEDVCLVEAILKGEEIGRKENQQ